MNKKYIIIGSIVVLAIVVVAGIFFLNRQSKDVAGGYFYKNDLLGFELTLPPEFIYYQTQRQDADGYSDLEIFVPTGDPQYLSQEVEDYGKPILVRVYKKPAAEGENSAENDLKSGFIKAGENAGNLYLIKFWDAIPADWQAKWTEEMKNSILEKFKLR
jgi:hypothetical protein